MNILLNGGLLNVEGVTSEETLADLLRALSGELENTGCVIMEIVADNIHFPVDKVELLESRKLVEFNNIDILTATARDLLKMAFEESDDVFAFIDEIALETATDLRVGKLKEAMERQLEVLDGLEWLSSILENLLTTFANEIQEMNKVSWEAGSLKLKEQLTTQMAALEQAMSNSDWIALADILEYEIPAITAEGRVFFGDLRSMLSSPADER